MVKKNEDGSFRIESLGVDVPDLDTMRAVIRELNAFNTSPEHREEALKQEKAARNFQKWRKTHLRKLRKELAILDLKKTATELRPGRSHPYTAEDEQKHAVLDAEYKSLEEAKLISVLNREASENESFWRVKLIELYGSKEDKEFLKR